MPLTTQEEEQLARWIQAFKGEDMKCFSHQKMERFIDGAIDTKDFNRFETALRAAHPSSFSSGGGRKLHDDDDSFAGSGDDDDEEGRQGARKFGTSLNGGWVQKFDLGDNELPMERFLYDGEVPVHESQGFARADARTTNHIPPVRHGHKSLVLDGKNGGAVCDDDEKDGDSLEDESVGREGLSPPLTMDGPFQELGGGNHGRRPVVVSDAENYDNNEDNSEDNNNEDSSQRAGRSNSTRMRLSLRFNCFFYALCCVLGLSVGLAIGVLLPRFHIGAQRSNVVFKDLYGTPNPESWREGRDPPDIGVGELRDRVENYVKTTLQELKASGSSLVQVGNEITNGMLWPAGSGKALRA